MLHPLPLARTGIHPAIAAAVAFVAAAILGMLDLSPLPALPDLAARLGVDAAPVSGLSLSLMVGLLAWHLAALTVPPRPAPVSACLVAALFPALLMPGVGLAVLLPPLALSFVLPFTLRRQRVVALLVQCGAVLALVRAMATAPSLPVDCILFATMALICGFSAFSARPRPANDNPLLKRPPRTGWFYQSDGNVSFAPVQSGEVGNQYNVQQ